MPRHCAIVVLLLILLALALPAVADTHRVPRVNGSLDLDGRMDEDLWRRAVSVELNYEVSPGENVAPPVRTVAWFAYNESHLLAAVRAYDPDPTRIRANYRDHDDLWGDDWCALVVDTFNDNRRQFDFFVNPLGVQADIVESNQGGGGSWDAIWNAGGRIDDEGYVVEFAIPFSSLRFPRVDGDQVWGIDVVRSYPRNVDHRLGLFPRERDNNCYMCQSDSLVGFAGATPGNNVEITPTVSAVVTETRNTDPKVTDESYEPGVTGRWGFTPNLTASATVNPDFSQVEADAAQLEINNQFALFYPESRPFFVEDAEFFSTRLRTVHTRSLADPRWGAKVAGKEGSSAIGAFVVRDDVTNFVFPHAEGTQLSSRDVRSTGAVARYRHDIGRSSTLGLLLTDRRAEGGYRNSVGGIDGDIRLTRQDQISFQVVRSDTRYEDATAVAHGQATGAFDGGAEELLYWRDTRNLDAYFLYRRLGTDFRSDLGFIPQVGFYQVEGGAEYAWLNTSDHWWNQLSVNMGYELNEKLDGGPVLHRMFNTWLNYAGLMQSWATVRLTFGDRTFNGREFDVRHYQLSSSFSPTGRTVFGLSVVLGETVDYAHTRPADRIRLVPSAELKLGRHLRAEMSHIFEKLDVDDGRLYTANVTEARLVYQINRRAFVRAILQRAIYDRNAAVYSANAGVDETSLLSQLLFSYKLNPRTVLFLGYADNYYGQDGQDPEQTDRTVFAKIGYAWTP
ncbi:MAG: carbohydrate binding family 9 domain-containing protein [bacterium]|nr:carbohydrate binding family 9 domain-containing protein [bacterium]